MEIKDRNKLIKLYDLYGNLLSKKENTVMENYLNQDLGESEIAEFTGETRQAIYDAVKRSKEKLQNFEDHCKFYSIISETNDKLEVLKHKLSDKMIISEIEKIQDNL